jgi:L-alanine-DL-glutamate epimerase-like enolase superfamily enzyme
VSDVLAIARSSAASAVNIKLTKSGLLGALDMIHLAKGHGLELMIGGMVESRLCMCVSACMAGGLGGFRWVDLDTPLFMKDSPLRGGYEQRGAGMRLDRIERGHGVRWQSDAPPDGAHEGTVLR